MSVLEVRLACGCVGTCVVVCSRERKRAARALGKKRKQAKNQTKSDGGKAERTSAGRKEGNKLVEESQKDETDGARRASGGLRRKTRAK